MPCIDIIVIRHRDGTLKSTPFFVRFKHAPIAEEEIVIKLNDRRIGLGNDTRMVLKPGEYFSVFEKRIEVTEYCSDTDSSDGNGTPNTPLTPLSASQLTASQMWGYGNQNNPFEPTTAHLHGSTLTVPQPTHHKRTRSWGGRVASSIKSGIKEGYGICTDKKKRHIKQRIKNRWIQIIDSKRMPDEFTNPPPSLLSQLNLNQEVTKIKFVKSDEVVEGRIFVWDERTKLLISDIDGTITKSDLRGQIMTRRLNMQYAHPGVALLFQAAMRRGFKLVYLSVRSMYQQESTINYIERIKQEDTPLPLGPVIIPPIVGSAIIRWKMPTEFKIPILQRLRSLFPEDHNPFIAGWGNRPTDAISYISAGIDPKRCFIVNKSGQIVSHKSKEARIEHACFRSYRSQADEFDKLNLESDLDEKVVGDIDNMKDVQRLTEKIERTEA